ncbi:MAG: sigma-70 family RNA polymerase sigma factor [Anaerolineae bacterium]
MSDYTPEPEMAQLFQRAQAGDRQSLNRLMRQHDGLVHHIIRQQWGGPLTYTETLQEGRIALWRAILGFDPEHGAAFSTYASVAIARQVWGAVDRAQKEQEDEWSFLAPSPFPHPRDVVLKQEIEEALDASVKRLRAKRRWVVRAHYGLDGRGGHTLAQLGRWLGCSRQAMHYHLQQALLRLRHPAFSATLRFLLGRNRRQDYRSALGQGGGLQ